MYDDAWKINDDDATEWKSLKPELRTAEVLVLDEWLNIPFENLKKGNTFRLTESTGELVSAMGRTEFIAVSDAYPDPITGLAMIDTLPPGDYPEEEILK